MQRGVYIVLRACLRMPTHSRVETPVWSRILFVLRRSNLLVLETRTEPIRQQRRRYSESELYDERSLSEQMTEDEITQMEELERECDNSEETEEDGTR